MINKFPVESLPALIEEYVFTREDRLALEKQVELLKRKEGEFKRNIEATLKEHNLQTAGGIHFRATIVPKEKPVAENWSLIYNHIRDTNDFDILQKRLTETAVKARWEDKIVIPGIVKFPITEISITKV